MSCRGEKDATAQPARVLNLEESGREEGRRGGGREMKSSSQPHCVHAKGIWRECGGCRDGSQERTKGDVLL